MDTVLTGTDSGSRGARYQEISAREVHADRTASRAVDRQTGAAVVLHRQARAGQAGVDAARRAARLDHPVLAPVIDVWVDDADAVVVQPDIAGHRLDDGGPPRAAAHVLREVLAPLAEGLDALHAGGLAHGAVTVANVVMARFGAGIVRPVLLGPPGVAAEPSGDRRDLAALALHLCEPATADRSPWSRRAAETAEAVSATLRNALAEAVGGSGREHPSCVALVDHLRRAAAGAPGAPADNVGSVPKQLWHNLSHHIPRFVPTVVLLAFVGVKVFAGGGGTAPRPAAEGRAWLVTTAGVAGATAPAPVPIVAGAATVSGEGLWLVASDGTVAVTGDAPPAEPVPPGAAPVVAALSRPEAGVWMVTADGVVHARSGAPTFPPAQRLAAPVVDATAVPGTKGAWLLLDDGTVSVAGSAPPVPPLSADPSAAAIAAHPDGESGWWVSDSGSIEAFGGAPALSSASPVPAGERVVCARPTPTGDGLWLLLSDGTVLSAGDAGALPVPAVTAPAVDLIVAP